MSDRLSAAALVRDPAGRLALYASRPVRSAPRTAAASAILLMLGVQLGCGKPDRTVGAPPAGGSAPGAAHGPAATTGHPLAGTTWRLVEFQSMDDAVGTIRPADPALYVMSLHGDGTVSMRVDCNRATGSWSAEPSADPSNGRFRFGPLAATRAACPPPSLDELPRLTRGRCRIRGRPCRSSRRPGAPSA